jgi:hypothetical protein
MTGHFLSPKNPEDSLMLYHTLSFENQETYLGLNQFKGHYDINIFFQFRTTKPNGKVRFLKHLSKSDLSWAACN